MKILAIDCSAVPCSAAVMADGKVLASAFSNVKVTHSQTLMPMVKSVLALARLDMKGIDGFAVSAGPGSFTGVRIGISAVKGLAAPMKKPCVPLSTLRVMAENFKVQDCTVCAVMDARCNQVYNAVFRVKDGLVTRLCEDRALLCDELAEKLKEDLPQNGENLYIVGDGAEIFYPFAEHLPGVRLAGENRRYQNAASAASASWERFVSGETVPPDELLPVYLRLPQAERELKLKKEKKL